MRVPRLGPAVPAWRNRSLRTLGRALLRIMGWSFEGEIPDVPKAVLPVAPHTSNWDFVVGIAAAFALGLRVRFLAKHTLFRGPLGAFMRWAGGLPVDRRAADRVVERALAAFRDQPQLFLAVAPEGTRRPVGRWRSGFYRIALAAGTPIVPVALDWSRRRIILMPPLRAGGDWEADEPRLKALYGPQMALRREGYWHG